MSSSTATRAAKAGASIIARVTEAVAVLLLWLIFAVLLSELISRNLFGHSLAGSWELASFMLAAMLFLGFSSALEAGTHIKVNLLPSLLSGLPAKIVHVTVLTIALTITLFATWALAGLATTSMMRETLSWELSAPLAVPQFVVTAGMALLTTSIALKLFVALFDQHNGEPKQ